MSLSCHFQYYVYRDGRYVTFEINTYSHEANITIFSVFTNILILQPSFILQSDKQRVILSFNQYFTSPYFTEHQITTVKLVSHHVESFTKVEPFSLRNTVLKYGPFLEKLPYAVSAKPLF